MEDANTLAADCVVISCCCQCLILQILIFIFLKLPHTLIRKIKNCAKRKLRKRKNKEGRELRGNYRNDRVVGVVGGSTRIQSGRFSSGGSCHDCGCCMEEIEKVMEELSQKGEFGFGSFWGEEESGGIFPIAKQEFDCSFVQYDELIKMVDSFSCS